jgi:hypothetical protein
MGADLGHPRVVAQINVARALEPLGSPRLQEFITALAPVNALADAAPGFVWRLQTEDGDATSIAVGDDELVIVNMSVWASLPELWRYVYLAGHLDVMRRRREWFEAAAELHMALWWLPGEAMPSVAEGLERLATIRAEGPTPHAFTFKQPYDRDGTPIDPAAVRA